MLCCVALRCVALRCVALCCVVLCCVVLRCIIASSTCVTVYFFLPAVEKITLQWIALCIFPTIGPGMLSLIEFFNNSDAILNFEHIAVHCGLSRVI